MIKLARLALLALAMLATLFSGTGFAFDGNRAGFILGIGAGGGYARTSVTTPNFPDLSVSKFAGKTDFFIGYAPSNRLAITWSNKVSWYSYARYYSFFADDIIARDDFILASSTGGLGITYFLSEDINANFIQAVIGFNFVFAPFEDDPDDPDSSTGFGLSIGVGREVSKNWIIGLDATWGRPESDATTFGIGVYFSHIWY